MLRFTLLQQDGDVYKVIDRNNDYNVLYRKMNDESLRLENKALTIVEHQAWFFPAKQTEVPY